MTINGQIKHIFATQQVSDKFAKREFVVTTEAATPYPQHISIQVTQDKCSMLDQYKEGDSVEVHINLRGREWNGPQGIKYFNTIEAWRITKLHDVPAIETPPATVKADVVNDNDDLPF